MKMVSLTALLLLLLLMVGGVLTFAFKKRAAQKINHPVQDEKSGGTCFLPRLCSGPM